MSSTCDESYVLHSGEWEIFDLTSQRVSKREVYDVYGRRPKKDSKKHAALVAELQTLSQMVNKTVEEIAQEVVDQQAVIKEGFCNPDINATSTKTELYTEICRNASNQRILMVFPVRDRWNLLRSLLKRLLPLLQKPNLCVFNVVVEQTDSMAFNKGLLMNAAVIEMAKRVPFDCIIFHDVDLVPASGDEVYYECPSYPRHLSVKVDKFRYSLPYLNLVGGILALPLRHFLQTNGYSNMFWGWGAEDDDMFERRALRFDKFAFAYFRLSFIGTPVVRPMPNPTHYTMLPHRSSLSLDSWRRTVLLKMALKRYRLDGLNSVRYKLLKNDRKSVCEMFGDNSKHCQFGRSYITHILVDPQKIESQTAESPLSST
ncbi:hypothetical protein ACTXT7_002364 [Hymenolepis weldensis]